MNAGAQRWQPDERRPTISNVLNLSELNDASLYGDLSSSRRYLQIAHSLLQAMTAGGFTEGDRLPPERELAQMTGVSRATMREALLALEMVGCVEVRVGDGAYVGPGFLPRGHSLPLDSDPRELLVARRIVEPRIAKHVAERGDQALLHRLTEIIDEGSEFSRSPERVRAFVENGLDFHRVLASLSGNPFLTETVRQLVDVGNHPLWLLANRATMADEGIRDRYLREHGEIVAAISDGDGATAERLMEAHISGMELRLFGDSEL
jgi:GntR family transcriptional repressor for pyruvate dehydrogenase complex